MIHVACVIVCGLLGVSLAAAQSPTTGGNSNFQSVASSFKQDVAVGNWNNADYWNGPEGYEVPNNRAVGNEVWFYSASLPPSGLGVIGGITVHLDMNPVVSALTLAAGAKVIVEPNFTLGIERRAGVGGGDLDNSGTVNVAGAGMSSRLSFITDDASLTQKISGSGAIRLGSSSMSFLEGAKLMQEPTHAIEGSGNVHVFELTNHGVMRTVTAADTLAIGLPSGISASVLINRGVVEAVNGGTVLIRNGSVKNADGLIRAQDQSIVRIAVPVVGGTLSSSGTGVVDMASGSLSNVSIQGTMRVTGMPWLDRDTSVLAGQTITNNGTIVFEPTGALGGFAVAYDQIMLDGNGEIDMGASGKGRIGCASASGAACPHRLVLGTGQLVRGSGELGASGLELVNHGRIVADRALPLTIQPSSGGMINLGIMEADGGTLRLSGATFINAGGIIRHAGASYVDLIGSGVTIAGGTLAGSGTGAVRIGAQSYLQNLTITGRVLVPANRLLSLNAGTIVNDGILRMEGSAAGNAFTRLNMGDVTLAGSGTLEMTGTQNIITSTAFAPVRTLVHGAAHTIRGGGQLGAGFLGIVNHGRILADAAATLVIDPDPVGGGLTNHGSLEAAAGATLTVTDSLTNYNATTKTLSGGRYAAYGTLRLANADIVNNAAWIDLVGPSSALLRHAGGTDALAGLAANSAGGTLKIMSGRSFTSAGDLTNAGVVTVGLGSTLNVGAAGGGTYRQTAGSTGGLGTLHAAQVQIVGGSFEPGASPGLLTVDGDLVIGPSAELLVEIGGPDKYDQLIVTGQMQLGGRLRITLVDGYQPHAPLGIQFITAAAISGEFATVELGAGIVGANLLSGASGLQLTVTPVPEPAAYLLMAAALATFGSTRRVSMRRPPSARASRQPTL